MNSLCYYVYGERPRFAAKRNYMAFYFVGPKVINWLIVIIRVCSKTSGDTAITLQHDYLQLDISVVTKAALVTSWKFFFF